jgi:A/G-specific adenine glycosylase
MFIQALVMKNLPLNEEKTILKRGTLFARELIGWNSQHNTRQMPWKGERDPYRIWLSEIMLQQTRVAQGMPYFEKFIAAFPTIRHLADAPDQQVFKLWEGLGYYSRCRNLLATARYIAYELDGVFPDSYEAILSLKGVGPYTAAAIASFAYNLPYAVLDGNVYRVLARIHGIDVPTDSTEGKALFTELAQAQLPEGAAAAYNQAIMDFGAVACKPMPECHTCFFKDNCVAFKEKRQLALPLKEKKGKVTARYFFYTVLEWDAKVALNHRQGKDIWQDLYEFLLLETAGPASWSMVAAELEKAWNIKPAHYERIGTRYAVKQRLTHQLVHLSFERIRLQQPATLPGMQWAPVQTLNPCLR